MPPFLTHEHRSNSVGIDGKSGGLDLSKIGKGPSGASDDNHLLPPLAKSRKDDVQFSSHEGGLNMAGGPEARSKGGSMRNLFGSLGSLFGSRDNLMQPRKVKVPWAVAGVACIRWCDDWCGVVERYDVAFIRIHAFTRIHTDSLSLSQTPSILDSNLLFSNGVVT